MSKQIALVLTLTIIALSVGVYVEICLWNDSDAIARSGAVIVCLSIFFGVTDLNVKNKIEQRNELIALSDTLNQLDQSSQERDIVFSDAQIEKKIRGSTPYLKDRAVTLYNTQNTLAAMIDIAVAIMGTLIWGFGDLVCILLLSCA